MVVAGYSHGLALRADGTLTNWGTWFNNGHYVSPAIPPGLTNVVAISAGVDHDLLVKADGTIVVWGYTNEIYNTQLAGLSGVKDVAAGWNHNVALLTNGTVVAWGANYGGWIGWNVTNVPAGLSNVVAIAAGGYHTLALKSDGTVVAWGAGNESASYFFLDADQDQSIVPAGLSNVVAIAAGGYHSLALKKDGSVVVWGDMSLPAYPLTRIIGLGSGVQHALAIYDGKLTPPVFISQSQLTNLVSIYGKPVNLTGTAIAAGPTNFFPLTYQWQLNGTNLPNTATNAYGFTLTDNTAGTYSLIASNAAGSASVAWTVALTNFIDVAQDLLLIYNTNSPDSKTVLDYYLAHRPGVSGANVLGIGCSNVETIPPFYFTNVFMPQIQAWLTNNPTKRPQYVILFYDVPSRVNTNSTSGIPFEPNWPSIQYYLYSGYFSGWNPFVTSINMASTNDCIGYINKLATIGVLISSNSPILSASAGAYGNTNFILDNVRTLNPTNYQPNIVSNAIPRLIAASVPTNCIYYLDGWENGITLTHLTNEANVAGYITWGAYTSLGSDYPINGKVKWAGNSGWWIMRSEESFNGQRGAFGQGNFIKWFSINAFGGTNYSNTPIGGVTYTDEPNATATDNSIYFGTWASGKNFAVSAWKSISSSAPTPAFQMVGDPFVTK